MASSEDLYNQRPAILNASRSAANSAFSAQLSSLISKSTSTDGSKTTGRPRKSKKDDIFTSHNRGALKRAAKDLQDDAPGGPFAQKQAKSSKTVDDATQARIERKMIQKAAKYDALKRGELFDDDEKYGVDFTQKWAEAHPNGSDLSDYASSDDEAVPEEEMVEWEDEFGRTMRTSKAKRDREERKRMQEEEDRNNYSARPAAPRNVIYGDTVQTDAFNPDYTIAQQMADLARKRDKSETPEEEHFDAAKWNRQMGTGHYQFSLDPEERKRQMQELEEARKATEEKRAEQDESIKSRKAMEEERRRLVRALRAKAQAERFLDDLNEDHLGGEYERLGGKRAVKEPKQESTGDGKDDKDHTPRKTQGSSYGLNSMTKSPWSTGPQWCDPSKALLEPLSKTQSWAP